jgi:hypothetical protein
MPRSARGHIGFAQRTSCVQPLLIWISVVARLIKQGHQISKK